MKQDFKKQLCVPCESNVFEDIIGCLATLCHMTRRLNRLKFKNIYIIKSTNTYFQKQMYVSCVTNVCEIFTGSKVFKSVLQGVY